MTILKLPHRNTAAVASDLLNTLAQRLSEVIKKHTLTLQLLCASADTVAAGSDGGVQLQAPRHSVAWCPLHQTTSPLLQCKHADTKATDL
jgi:hypothetical protein